jgi:hypothetical protein
MPHRGLETLRVGRDVVGVYGGNDTTGVGDLGGIPAVAADDAEHGRADFLGELDGADEVGADVLLLSSLTRAVSSLTLSVGA